MCPSCIRVAPPPWPLNSRAARHRRAPPWPSAALRGRRYEARMYMPPGRRSKPMAHTPPTIRHITCTPAHAQKPKWWHMQITATPAPRAHGIPGTSQRHMHKKRRAWPLQFRVRELATARPHGGRLPAQAHTRNAPHTNKLIHLEEFRNPDPKRKMTQYTPLRALGGIVAHTQASCNASLTNKRAFFCPKDFVQRTALARIALPIPLGPDTDHGAYRCFKSPEKHHTQSVVTRQPARSQPSACTRKFCSVNLGRESDNHQVF